MYKTKIAYQPLARLRMAFRSRKRSRDSLLLGVIATLLASLSFTLMSACAKALSPMSSGEMTFFRGLVGLLFIPILCRQTKEIYFSGTHKAMLCLRGFFGSMGLFFLLPRH